MTRDDIVAEVGRRVTNVSTDFNNLIDNTFDFVLADLAQKGAISALNGTSTFTTGPDGTRQYATRTITGLASPHYPYHVFSIYVPEWGTPDGLITRVSDEVFAAERTLDSAESGRHRIWRLYPNESQVDMWPPVGSAESGATAVIHFINPPSILAGLDEVEEVRFEDLETLTNGVLLWAIRYLPDEELQAYVADRTILQQLYDTGVAQMVARSTRRLTPPRRLRWMELQGAAIASTQRRS